MSQTQRCIKCGKVKPLDEFYRNPQAPSGKRHECKSCFSIYCAGRHRANPAYSMWCSAKQRAKKHGLPFDLTPQDILVPTHCPILGIPLIISKNGKGKPSGNSPTLDRIDPTLGYVRDNVWVVSSKANRMKQDMSPEGLLEFATKVYDAVYCNQNCAVPNQP